jgi:cell division protein FtsL
MSRRTFFFGLLIAALLIFSLYRAKYGARDTAADLMEVDAQIEAATKEKVMLETELAHMSRRDSIEEYARKKLGMAPPKADQMADEADLDVLVGPPTDELVPAAVPGESPAADAPAEATP